MISVCRGLRYGVLVGCIWFAADASKPAGKIELTRDMKAFRRSVLKVAPFGLTEAETAARLQAEKFSCFHTAGEFYPMDAEGKFTHQTIPHAEMLFCYYQAPGIWSNDKWRAVFLLQNARTVDLFVMFHVISL